jgi:putative endonuclease
MPFFTRPAWLLADRLRRWLERRRLPATKALGNYGEDLAHRFLERQGYVVMDRNWRSRSGLIEVDIIAYQKEPERYVFVEVKTRTTAEFAAPDRTIDKAKETAYRSAALQFIRENRIEEGLVRFDNIFITIEPAIEIVHNPDAYSL